MSVRFILMPVLLGIMFFFNNCASYKAMQNDISSIQSEIDSLKLEIDSLQGQMRFHNELLRLMRADQQLGFEELERNVNTVFGSIKESQQQLYKIDEKTRKLKEGWEEKARADSVAEVKKHAEVEGLFEVAISDFNAGRIAVALAGFDDIIKRFPSSPRTEESEFWIAECYFIQKKHSDAENEYKNYLKNYPQGKMVCGSLYKLGLIYKTAKKETSNTMVWDKLLTQCPESKEAEIVRSQAKKE